MIETFEHGTYLLGHHIEEIISDERCEGSCIGTLNDITDSHGETIKSGRSRYIGPKAYRTGETGISILASPRDMHPHSICADAPDMR